MDDLMCKVQIRHKEEQFSLNTEHVMILYGYCNRPEARYGLPPPQGEFCRP